MLNYIDIEDYVTSIQYLNYPDAAVVTLLASVDVDILASISYPFSVFHPFHHIHPSPTLVHPSVPQCNPFIFIQTETELKLTEICSTYWNSTHVFVSIYNGIYLLLLLGCSPLQPPVYRWNIDIFELYKAFADWKGGPMWFMLFN